MPGTATTTPDDQLRDLVVQVESLLALGPSSRHALVTLADRGDWRTRVVAASALGTLIRRERTAQAPISTLARCLALVPGLRRHLPTVGANGRLVSRSLVNLSTDRSFIVRTAAVAAAGECLDTNLSPSLVALLADPFLPVRVAAAAALIACGRQAAVTATFTNGCEPTPTQMAEGVSTLEWLEFIVSAHLRLFAGAAAALGVSGVRTAADAARWLAGSTTTSGQGGAAAEAVRYDDEADLEYQLAKPFGAHDRAENLRQLDAFVALVAHLDLPRGARIIDLGGGSGWVAELLARFGFEPVVVDVALPLLRLAHRRFAEKGLAGRVVAGDVTSLPLRSGSVDAIIAMDALHHIQDLAGVMREARRVLVSGGQFLIAEPGEGHSESPKSLAESREHGVRESEINPFTLEPLVRAAGFDHVSLLPRLPSQAAIDIGELRRAMLRPADEWPVHHAGSETRFATLALRAMLARPLIVLGAGRRPRDTRAPGVLQAEIEPHVARTDQHVRGHIVLRNSGDTTWLAGSGDDVGAVWLGAQRLDRDGRMLDRECWRVPLPAAVAPGTSCLIGVALTLPADVQACRLKFDLVAERVCWFEDRGSRPAHVNV